MRHGGAAAERGVESRMAACSGREGSSLSTRLRDAHTGGLRLLGLRFLCTLEPFICVGTSLQVGRKLDGVWRVGPCLAVLMLPSHGAAEGGTFSSGHRRLEAHSRADGGAAGRMRGPRSLRGATRHKAVWALARRVCLDG